MGEAEKLQLTKPAASITWKILISLVVLVGIAFSLLWPESGPKCSSDGFYLIPSASCRLSAFWVVLKCFLVTAIAMLVQGLLPYIWQPPGRVRVSRTTRKLQEEAEALKSQLPESEITAAQGKVKLSERNLVNTRDVALKQGPLAPERGGESTEEQKQYAKAQEEYKAAVIKNDEAVKAVQKSNKKIKQLEEFQMVWPKLSQPEYAIGLGLMSQSDYNALSATYQTQSTLVIGLVIPLFLLVSILLIRIGQFYPVYPRNLLMFRCSYVVLGALQTLLFLAAADLKHKFEMSTQAMIAASYVKLLEGKKSSKGSAKPVDDQINAALEAATILRTTDLKIKPGNPPAAPPAAGNQKDS